MHRLGGLVGWSIMDAVKYKCGWKPLDSFATLGVGFPFCTFPVCFFSMFFSIIIVLFLDVTRGFRLSIV